METTNPMALLQGFDRLQASLFPVSIYEMIPRYNEVRKKEAFVQCINFDEPGLRDDSKSRAGRPGYDPADLMKLYIYGYLNRIRTSRLMERECHRNVELIWQLKGFICGNLSWFFNILIKKVQKARKKSHINSEIIRIIHHDPQYKIQKQEIHLA